MSITKLPSGRWRAQIYDPDTKNNVPVSRILDLPKGTTWATKREAKMAREKARELIEARTAGGVTVRDWWERWTTEPIFARPKLSSDIHRAERTRGFVARYGDRQLDSIGDEDVAAWLAGGKNVSTIPSLRTMWNDAADKKAGRLVEASRNPFAGLGVEKHTRADEQPPSIEQAHEMVAAAFRVSVPSFAGWLQCAMWTGMRPGELDALTWADVDLDAEMLTVRRQWNVKTKTFTAPKNGKPRPVPLFAEAMEAIQNQPQVSEFVFVNLRGSHWRPSTRAYHWNAVRAAVSWDKSLYTATRHFAGWFQYDQMLLPAEDVAFALGHEDHGELVRSRYGHRDRDAALERVKAAKRAHDLRMSGQNVHGLRSVS